MSRDPTTQHDYNIHGRTPDSASRIGHDDAFYGRGMTPQQHNEPKDLYDQRQASHQRELDRQAEERKRNGGY